MRNKTLFIALVLGLGLTMIALWLLGAQVSSAVAAPEAERVQVSNAPDSEFHVCPSGCPYDSIQEAVEAASDGDVIKVAAGTYTGVSAREGITQMVYLSKAVTIQGGYTTSNWTTPAPEVNITTLDAHGQGRVFYISAEGIPTIAGLHITGGNASNQGRGEAGGGIYAEIKVQISPTNTTIADNHIYSNTAYNGGGVYLDQGAPFTLSGNTISSNTAGRAGGGMVAHAVAITMINNVFAGNSASLGGGLDVEFGEAVLQGNTFRANSAGEAGGGVFVYGSTAKFDTNVVVSNTASRGGGLAIFGKQDWRDSALVNTLVAENQASLEGAGIYISGAPLHLWHTTLARNSGGDGSGVTIGSWNPWASPGASTVDLTNTILVSQSVGLRVADGSTVNVDSILWYNTPITVSQNSGAVVSVQNQITGDPDFLDPDGGDYHIGAASAARDAGIVSRTLKDLDGQVRPMGFGYDLGTDEYSEAALSLVKTPSLVGANVGQDLTYSILMTSSGSQGTSGVVLTDTLGAWQRATGVASTMGNCTIVNAGWGGRVVCAPGVLNMGDSILISITTRVSSLAPIGQAMPNTLVARANETANSTQAVVYAQDCHARIGDNATEYTSVQAAVDAADPGALVKVAGTCMGVGGHEGARQQVYLDKLLTIRGGYTTTNWTTPNPEANPTTLDARGQGRVMFIRHVVEDIGLGSVIDGLHITGGNAYGQVGGHSPIQRESSAGGGVYVFGSDPTLSNNHIFGNTAALGGGMYTSFCNLTVRGTTFSANTALGDGGGLLVHAGGAIMIDNRFDSNSAENGGGFAGSAGGGDFTRNTFIGNHARAFGGGLALETAAQIKETLILSNTAERGGGIAFYTGINNNFPYATLINTVIAGNQASLEGAGVFIPSGGAVHLLQTTLARNRGKDGSGVTLGWYDWQGPGASTVVMTNTILANQDVGIRVADSSDLTVNSVLWYATPTTISQAPGAVVSVQNQHTGNPAFVNPAGGDYHIGATSAARDAGVDNNVTIDIDGQLRPMGLGWDLGADEYPAPVLSVSSQPSAVFVNQGQAMTYSLSVTNIGAGSAAATGVVLTDTLDSWQRATGASASAGNCRITDPGWGGAVVCSVGALGTGATATITLTVEVSANTPLRQAMLNAVVARANQTRKSTAQATAYAQDCHVRINSGLTTYASVQAAVDAAGPGDLVKVAGTCVGVGERAGLRQQVYLEKSLTVRGGYMTTNWITPDPEANPTTLDALGEGRVFYITGASSPTIEGLRITGGDAAWLGGVSWGWDAGGGLYVVSATATISNNWIYNNTAGEEFTLGGGMFLQSSASTVFSNAIYSNTAGYGGGILTLESSAALSNNTILSNTAIKGGGGVALWGLSEGAVVVFTANIVRGNTAHEIGGGMSVGVPGSKLINNIITDNSADVSGSGLYIDGSAQFWHTTVAGNTGGDGSGIYVNAAAGSSSVAFTNTILVQHSVGISVTAGNTVNVNGILWYATPTTISQAPGAVVSVQNQHTGNPAFLDPANGDYHIGAASAARDAGVDSGVTRDIDGQTRPMGEGYDLGADEYLDILYKIYLPLVMRK
jgi:uncharacterized repeat protein (TIGR01451 family)